jgi:hypothetical protein
MEFKALFVIACLLGFTNGQQCKSLRTGTASTDAQRRLTNPCTRVVDYDYYLPQGVTDAIIEAQVNALLNVEQLKSLSTECQESFLEYTCAMAYMKCQPNINLADRSTYNFDIYPRTPVYPPIPLPFQR